MAKKKKPDDRVGVRGANGKVGVEPLLFDWSTFDPAAIDGHDAAPLADELVTFRDHLQELLRDEGKYVLIKGREVIGIYGRREEALREAVSRFQDAPVLVKQIVAKELIHKVGGAVI
jgi:hypothetical protein